MSTRVAGKFGKQSAQIDPRTPLLKAYLTPSLPQAPQALSPLDRVLGNLHKTEADIPALFPLDGNAEWGDCVVACADHLVTMFRGMLGSAAVYGEQDTVNLYLRLTGGQDTGLVISQFLKTWSTQALINHDRILTYATIDIKDHETIKQAIQLFGGVFTGFNVTDQTINQFNAGQPWTPGTLIGEGHAVPLVAYDETYVTALTWGNKQLGSWAWLDACMDEAWAVLPPEAESMHFDGLNLKQLVADMKVFAA